MIKRILFLAACLHAALPLHGQTSGAPDTEGMSPIVVSATRLPTDLDQSPSSTSVITDEQIEEHQYRFTTDALRSIPGLEVVQTGTPGQLTSVFIRGNRSDQTQVLLDGIQFNQGLAGLFNFADLTNDDVERIEVIRGPQSALYGSQASGGVINIIPRRGTDSPHGSVSFEGGSYNSFREVASSSGKFGMLDYSVGLSRYDTEGARQNSAYRASSLLSNVGFSPTDLFRLGLIVYYDQANAGSPNTITDPRPYDHLRTERWLMAPTFEFKPWTWWNHHFYFSYDQERQINNPNRDGFTGPTRGIFRRAQLEYQNDLQPFPWLTLTSGIYYNHIDTYQERPEVSFGSTLIRAKSENAAGFGQIKLDPVKDLHLYAGMRYDRFRGYTGRFTYRFAANYQIPVVGTILRSSYGTGFTPPSPQDRIFGGNPNLRADRDKGFDAGLEQPLFNNRLRLGGNFFYSTASNTVGFNSDGLAFNLGKNRIQGIELFASWTPLTDLTVTANYTYLDAVNTSDRDTSLFPGSRLVRRPRNAFYISGSYLWYQRLLTTAELRTENARQDANFDVNGVAPNVNLEDYTVVRLAAEYRVNERLTIQGRIENLLDEKYAEVLGYPSLGRVFYGGLQLSF